MSIIGAFTDIFNNIDNLIVFMNKIDSGGCYFSSLLIHSSGLPVPVTSALLRLNYSESQQNRIVPMLDSISLSKHRWER